MERKAPAGALTHARRECPDALPGDLGHPCPAVTNCRACVAWLGEARTVLDVAAHAYVVTKFEGSDPWHHVIASQVERGAWVGHPPAAVFPTRPAFTAALRRHQERATVPGREFRRRIMRALDGAPYVRPRRLGSSWEVQALDEGLRVYEAFLKGKPERIRRQAASHLADWDPVFEEWRAPRLDETADRAVRRWVLPELRGRRIIAPHGGTIDPPMLYRSTFPLIP